MGAGVAKLYKEVMNGARFLVVIAREGTQSADARTNWIASSLRSSQ
jgi:hypothetical protein